MVPPGPLDSKLAIHVDSVCARAVLVIAGFQRKVLNGTQFSDCRRFVIHNVRLPEIH